MEYRAGSWSLDEEINLLEAMLICGLDWPSISKRCAGRTADECERHYYNYFIDNPRLIELSNLLTKTREASSNYRKFLCPSLVADNTVCGCVDNECDNNFSSISNTKKENSTTNLDAFKRTCESSDVSVKNEIFETNFDECKERKGTDSSKFVTKDINCSVSVSKTFEHKESLPENFNLKGIKQEVESDFTSEVKICSSTIDGSNHFNSESSTHNIKLESDILSEVCSSETVKRNALEASNEEPSDFFQETTTENAELQRMRAGFDANRTEFDIEFDNGAEEVLNLLSHEIIQDDEDEDKRLVTELSLSGVEGYRHRLRERHRRKALVQRFGLLDYSKISNYMKTVESTFGKRFAKRLVLFKRLFTTKEYDNFMKGYQHLNQLKNHLNTLCNYRERGITTLAAGNLYEEMSKMRNESNKQIQSIPVVKRLENGESVLGHVFRRPAPPIAIHEMPGYECLEREEVDFCSIQRIAPKSFLEYKNTLINECRKRKCLKLAHARPLLKIDVNKTRKLYDLLLNKNLIWKDEKMTDQ